MDKWFGLALFLLSSYELVHGQCFLNIELNQFQNLRSVEIRQDPGGNDKFCCCDDDDDSLCQINADLPPTDLCEPFCDTFFVVNLECEYPAPCPVSMITDVREDSATTTDVNYKFCFDLSSSAEDSVSFKIAMRDSDDESSFSEIDTFDITATFPSDNEHAVVIGNRGIANITLTYDIICIEPDSCTTAVASSDLIDSCAVIDTTTSVVTSTKVVKSTSIITVVGPMSVVTSTQLVIATSTTTTIASTTSTTTEMQSLTTTATVETVSVTISAMSKVITVTSTVSVNSSPKDSPGQQPAAAGSCDSTLMTLFILFALLTIVLITISIYLACLLMKKNKFKFNTKPSNLGFLQTERLSPMDNPVYELQETIGRNNARHAVAVYRALPSDLYADTSASENDIYSTCGPARLTAANENYAYVRPVQLDESEAAPYEIPVPLARSK